MTSPWGTLTYTKDKEGTPTGQTITLSPTEQANYDRMASLRAALTGNLPTSPFTPPDMSRADQVEKALYDRQMALIRPDLDAADNAKRVELADRGIPIGSEIYNNESDRLSRNRTQAEQQAAESATLAGGQEQDRLLQNALTERNIPFNELASVMGGVPSQLPGFASNPAYQLQPGDYQGQVNTNYTNALNQYNQQRQALSSGLFGLGSALIMSDRRTKKNIKRVGETDAGLPIYSYAYKHEGQNGPTHLGVMADEAEDFFPDAVATFPGTDIKGVDYGAIA